MPQSRSFLISSGLVPPDARLQIISVERSPVWSLHNAFLAAILDDPKYKGGHALTLQAAMLCPHRLSAALSLAWRGERSRLIRAMTLKRADQAQESRTSARPPLSALRIKGRTFSIKDAISHLAAAAKAGICGRLHDCGRSPESAVSLREHSLLEGADSLQGKRAPVKRAMNENANQGFWNGITPPLGYVIVGAEQRGSS